MIAPALLILPWLKQQFPTTRAGTQTPSDLAAQLPFIKVYVGSGTRTDYVLGRRLIDLEVYAATEPAAATLAGQVDDAVAYQLGGTVLAGLTVTSVQAALSSYRPYDNQNVCRYGAAHTVWLKDLQPAH